MAPLHAAMWCLQDAKANMIAIYEGDTDVMLDRYRPGALEAALWTELVSTSAKGFLQHSSGFRIAPDGTTMARGEYCFYANEAAGEQQSI